MLRSLKMHGIAQAVIDLIEQGAQPQRMGCRVQRRQDDQICSIPDDHIDPQSSAFFMARLSRHFRRKLLHCRSHRKMYWVEPMCKILQIAPSTYHDRRAIARDPERASARAKSDAALSLKIDAAWEDTRP